MGADPGVALAAQSLFNGFFFNLRWCSPVAKCFIASLTDFIREGRAVKSSPRVETVRINRHYVRVLREFPRFSS